MLNKIISSLLTRVLILGLNFIAGILTARYLQPEGKGIYSLYLLILTFLINIGDLGISNAAVYYAGVYKQSGHKEKTYTTCFGLSLISSLTILVVFYGYLFFFRPSFIDKLGSPQIILSFALLLPLSLIFMQYRNIELGLERVKSYNLINTLQALTLFLFLIVAIVIFRQGYTGAISAYGLSSALVAVLLILKNVKNIDRQNLLDLKAYKKFIIYGIKVYAVGVFGLVILRLDSLILANYSLAEQLGYYTVAVSLGEMLLQFPNMISLLLFSSSSNDPEGHKSVRMTCFLTRISILLLFIMAGLMFLLSDYIIGWLYSNQYGPAVLPFKILIPGIYMYSIFQFLYGDILGKGRPELVWPPVIVSAAITLLLDLTLIPRFGIKGAAIASTVSYTSATVFILFTYKRLVKVKLTEILLVRKKDLEYIWQIRKRGRSLVNIGDKNEHM